MSYKRNQDEKTESYVLRVDAYSKPIGEGPDRYFEEYGKGDTVELHASDAERLLKAGAIERPGESQERERSQLEARLEQLKAEQAQLEEQQRTVEAQREQAGEQQLDVDSLDARKLNSELKRRDLSVEGSLEQKRARLRDALPHATSGAPVADEPGRESDSSRTQDPGAHLEP